MTNVQGGYTPLPVPCGKQPDCKLGRRAIHVLIDFSLGTDYQLDLSQVQSQGALDSVQTLYIDNSKNAEILTTIMGLTLQEIDIPPGAQAYIPVLQGNPPILRFNVAAGTPVVNIQLLNFFIPPCVWYTNGMPVTDLTLLGVIANGGVNVNATPVTLIGITDGSGTIAAAGVPQVLFAAMANRKKWILSNPSTATEVLQYCYGIAGAGKIDLPPGTTYVEADICVSGDELWVVAATLGHAFTAYQE